MKDNSIPKEHELESTSKLDQQGKLKNVEGILIEFYIKTVDKYGVVTARGQGQTEIYCIADSGVEASFTMIVLGLNSSSITVEQYDSYIL